MITVKSGLEIQTSLENKAEFKNLKIVASYTCADNEIASADNVHDGIRYFNNGYLAAVSETESEVSDLFDLKNGTCCRITSPDEERRISAVLMDENYLYAIAVKGFDAKFRNLVKYDLATSEIVWSCGASSHTNTPRITQDADYIYASDVKTLFITSKTAGKTTKLDVAPKMNNTMKFYSNAANRFINVVEIAGRNMILSGSLANVTLVDPVEAKIMWEIDSNKSYKKIISSIVYGDKLYILGEQNKLLVINVADGKVEKEVKIDCGMEIKRCPDFFAEGGELSTILRADDYRNKRILLTINIKDLSYTTKDLTESLPECGLYDPYEIIKDGVIVFANRNQVTVLDKNSCKKISSLETKGDDIIDFRIVGDCIYLAQEVKHKDKNNYTSKTSILHQIR